MKKLRYFVQWFITITAGILFICAMSCTLSGAETVSTAMLWQILLSAALCALATVLFYPMEYHGKTRTVLGIALHFVSLCAIMVYSGISFGWMTRSIPDVVAMIGAVVIVYAFTQGVTYALEKKQADTMSQILREKYSSDTGEEKK